MAEFITSTHKREVTHGKRFLFGRNWSQYLGVVDEERIAEARGSLQSMLEVASLTSKSFLDVGCGSGLFSLAARQLGAKVHSFDYDPQSVTCTKEMKRRHVNKDDDEWTVEEASVLDSAYMARLGCFDVVYAWGVLHHTGAMWTAIEHVISKVAPGGRLFIAIYNDQGWKSHMWWFVKLLYNKLPDGVNTAFAYAVGCAMYAFNIIKYTLMFKPMTGLAALIHRKRGMSVTRDLIDWIGGFPYEFADYDVLCGFMRARGFELRRAKRSRSLGCHELVFELAPVQTELSSRRTPNAR